MSFPIRWGKPRPQNLRLSFVKCPPDQWVYMFNAPDQLVTIPLHWLGETGESGICPGDTCPLLGMTRHFESCYAPVLEFQPKEGRWIKKILGIGDPGHTLANTDWQGMVIKIGRSKVEDEKRIIYLATASKRDVPMPPYHNTFDVRPHLLRRWGLYGEAELLGCEMHSPAQEQAAEQTERKGES